MSNYHITQEQAWKVAEDLDYINSPESGLSGTVLMSKLELQAYANAVLDKVLGEPIYLCERPDGIYYELDASEYDPRTDLLLYAPKELL